jgi:hypothetical protein
MEKAASDSSHATGAAILSGVASLPMGILGATSSGGPGLPASWVPPLRHPGN